MPRAGRRRRLSRSTEFERVYRHGRSKANRFLVLYAFPRDGLVGDETAPDAATQDADASLPADGGAPDGSAADSVGRALPLPLPLDSDAGQPRLGLSVSRRVGGAVDRARVKRTLREAFRANAGGLPAGADYVIVARPPARELAEREGTAGIERELSELIAALGGGGQRPRPSSSEPSSPQRNANGEASSDATDVSGDLRDDDDVAGKAT